MAKKIKGSPRQIQTVFYMGSKPVKYNRSTYRMKAVQNAMSNLQLKKYKANNCEVFDLVTGKLLAAVEIDVKNSITILFKDGMKS